MKSGAQIKLYLSFIGKRMTSLFSTQILKSFLKMCFIQYTFFYINLFINGAYMYIHLICQYYSKILIGLEFRNMCNRQRQISKDFYAVEINPFVPSYHIRSIRNNEWNSPLQLISAERNKLQSDFPRTQCCTPYEINMEDTHMTWVQKLATETIKLCNKRLFYQ